jgi:hypothetical protein
MHLEKEGEPPATMLAVYEYLHRKHIDKVADIKRYQDMYKQTDIKRKRVAYSVAYLHVFVSYFIVFADIILSMII